jgi:uncharacterized membrane protein YebE (DUF533 family)
MTALVKVRQRQNATEIASQILAEMLDAAKVDGVTFDAEQRGFIEQALSDAALEAFLQVLRELREVADAVREDAR